MADDRESPSSPRETTARERSPSDDTQCPVNTSHSRPTSTERAIGHLTTRSCSIKELAGCSLRVSVVSAVECPAITILGVPLAQCFGCEVLGSRTWRDRLLTTASCPRQEFRRPGWGDGYRLCGFFCFRLLPLPHHLFIHSSFQSGIAVLETLSSYVNQPDHQWHHHQTASIRLGARGNGTKGIIQYTLDSIVPSSLLSKQGLSLQPYVLTFVQCDRPCIHSTYSSRVWAGSFLYKEIYLTLNK